MDLSYDEAIKTLREWRESCMRKSQETVEIGEKLLKKSSLSMFNDEIWLICEQVYVAALDVGRFDLADVCMSKLCNNFPDSVRVATLDAMKLEAIGDYDEALEIYNQLIKENPTNAEVRKRKVGLLKSKGNNTEAIKELCNYLEDFMVDHQAWYELSELYLKEMDYAKAAFCFEELILSNAFNHLYHQRYAEIKYTMGGQENINIAKKHFSQAIKLSCNTNMRALNGLLYTSYAMTNSKSTQKGGNNRSYATWAAKMILKKYEDAGQTTNEIVRRKETPQFLASATLMLKNLGISNT